MTPKICKRYNSIFIRNYQEALTLLPKITRNLEQKLYVPKTAKIHWNYPKRKNLIQYCSLPLRIFLKFRSVYTAHKLNRYCCNRPGLNGPKTAENQTLLPKISKKNLKMTYIALNMS